MLKLLGARSTSHAYLCDRHPADRIGHPIAVCSSSPLEKVIMGIATAAPTETSDTTVDPRPNAPRQGLPWLRILAWGGVMALAVHFIGTRAVRTSRSTKSPTARTGGHGSAGSCDMSQRERWRSSGPLRSGRRCDNATFVSTGGVVARIDERRRRRAGGHRHGPRATASFVTYPDCWGWHWPGSGPQSLRSPPSGGATSRSTASG